jgi:hypothetical protein
MNTSSPTAWVRAGLLALPLYAILVGYGTLRPEPDQVGNPQQWAQFVTTTSYLVEHLLANVIGTVLVILGTFALATYLAGSRATRPAMWGLTVATTAHVLFTVPGVISTFATPAIGHAYLAGNHAAMTVAFSPVMTAIFGLALLLALAGNILLGIAVWRSDRLPRWSGLAWASGTVVFYLLGAVLGLATTGASLPTQPLGAVMMLIAGGTMAWAATNRRRTGGTADTPLAPVSVDQRTLP